MKVIPPDFPLVTSNNVSANVARAVPATASEDTLEGLVAEFHDVFDEETITPMTGDPLHIHVRRDDPNYKPLRVFTARKVPLHYAKEAGELVDLMLKSGVIERVPTDETSEWCSPAFFRSKASGGVRMVTDFRVINQFIERPVHPFPSCKDIIRSIRPDSRYFLKFDAVQGYHQVPLDEESSKLTTFLTEYGRFRFKRAPMGLIPCSDFFCERTDSAFAEVDNLLKIVDNGLLQAPSQRVLLQNFRLVLECARRHNLTLSRPKLEMGQSVVFAGHLISHDGVRPDPRRTDAIANFPAPTNVSELRSFLGLVNQLGVFLPDLAHATLHLRGLLRKNVAFLWLEEQRNAFSALKKLLLSPLVVRPFDISAGETRLLTDASRLKGLGYALLQSSSEGLSLIQCGSRSLNGAESRYSTTELECLGIYYAIKECKFFLQGANFTVVTDHQPLVGVFRKHLAELENMRLLRFRERLTQFSFCLLYTSPSPRDKRQSRMPSSA